MKKILGALVLLALVAVQALVWFGSYNSNPPLVVQEAGPPPVRMANFDQPVSSVAYLDQKPNRIATVQGQTNSFQPPSVASRAVPFGGAQLRQPAGSFSIGPQVVQPPVVHSTPRRSTVGTLEPALSNSNGVRTSIARSTAFATAPTPARKTQILVSLPASLNATNVRTLVRTDYELPKEATKILKQFFELEDASKIEVTTVEKENSPLVVLRVTTDDKTQNSIAQFLAAVYPQKKIDQLKVQLEEVELTEVRADEPATTAEPKDHSGFSFEDGE